MKTNHAQNLDFQDYNLFVSSDLRRLFGRIIAGTALALVLASSPVFAIERHWTGEINGLWSVPANWNPIGQPQNGDTLYIDDSSNTSITNDMVNLVVSQLRFLSSTDFQLRGNSLTVTNSLDLGSDGSATVIISCPLVLTAGCIVDSSAGFANFTDDNAYLYLNGPITISNGVVTMFVFAEQTGPTASSIGHIAISGTISGNGDLQAETTGSQDDASFEFLAPFSNSFTGTLFLSTSGDERITFNTAGPTITNRIAVVNGATARVNFSQADQIGHNATVVLSDGAQFVAFQNDVTIGTLMMTNRSANTIPTTLDTQGTTWTIQNGITTYVDNNSVLPTIKGKLALATGGRAFSINGTVYAGLDMQAQVSGAGGIVESGNAALLLESSNSFSGQVFVTSGIIDVRNGSALGTTGGATTLTGSGLLTLRNVSVSGETLNVQGNTVVTAFTTGSQVNAIGTCNWLGPISLSSSLNLFAEDLAVTGPITGSGGLEMTFGDVRMASAGADNTFTGTTYVHCPLVEFDNVGHKAFSGPLVVGGPSVGSCQAKWLTGSQGAGGTLVVYSNGVVNLTNFNDTFASITFNGGTVETGSGTVTVNQNITSNPTNTTAFITGNLAFASGDSAIFNVSDGAADPDLEVDANISGATTKITKQQSGKLTWGGNNTFTGPTDVKAGILEVTSGSALGSTGAGNSLTVETNATLRLSGSGSTAKTILVSGTGSTGSNGVIDVTGSYTITGNLTLSTASTISVEQGGGIALNDVISGTGPLTKTGSGGLGFGGSSANTYSGTTFINEGTLNLTKFTVTAVPGDLWLGPAPAGSFATAVFFQSAPIGGSTVTVNANSTLNVNGYSQTISQLTLNDGGSAQTGAGSLTFTGGGQVSVGSQSILGSRVGSAISGIIGLPANSTLNFAVGAFGPFANLSGPELDVTALIPKPVEIGAFAPAGIAKSGSGTMRLTANNGYKGSTEIDGGTLDVEGSQPGSQVFADGGILEGAGTVGHIYPAGGSIAPGAGPGILTCSNFNAGGAGPGTLQIQLNGTTAGSGYDQLTVRGTVNLSGISLSASINFASATNDQFVIINNDGSDAVTGTFNGFPQNSVLNIGGQYFTLSYTGGSGNDVVLTHIPTPILPRLVIQSIPPAAVRLLWPTNDPAFSLQSNTNLATNIWTVVSPAPVVIGTNYVVTNAAAGGPKFYRLSKP